MLDPAFQIQSTDPASIVWEIDTDRADIQLPLEKAVRTEQEEGAVYFPTPQMMSTSRPELDLGNEEVIAIRLNAQMEAALDEFGQMTLAELVERYPVKEGLAEVLTYLSIAALPDNQHFMEPGQVDVLPLNGPDTERYVQGARVILIK
ncbi:MAG: DUF3375 family protein [Lewinellaceae bacterium]|nr:DUF3375 family protein [Lewinellaceae bacterium]